MTPPRSVDAVVIGAGPYGAACAAFLRARGADVAVFGEPMGFWRDRMPEGMLLRSRRRSSHIADPDGSLSLDAFESSTRRRLSEPIRVEEFVDYGRWFLERTGEVDNRSVRKLREEGDGLRLELDDGDALAAERVIVAAGLAPFAFRPERFGRLPSALVSHSGDHRSFEQFRDRRVIVVGCGQSALESAALLAEAGADVEILCRAASPVWLPDPVGPAPLRQRLRASMAPPTDVGGRLSGWLAATPDLIPRAPARTGEWVRSRCLRPAGAHWLRSRLKETPITAGRAVIGATGENGTVRVDLDDGSHRDADHVVLATGWRVDVSRYGFLAQDVLGKLETAHGYPLLGRGLESSVEGLHFVGAPASLSFGPIMRFVVGTWYAAPVIARAVAGKRQRALRFAYRPRRSPVRTS